jgi:hypothetical protein
MSSIVRAPRQRLRDCNYVSLSSVLNGATSLTAGTGSAFNIFEFVTAPNNYVGNYPPGGMVTASTALCNAINSAIIAVTASGGSPSSLVLRDMGKTLRAQIGAIGNFGGSVPSGSLPAQASTVSAGTAYFRQVQLLYPTALGQSYSASPSGNLFGMQLNGPNAAVSNVDINTPYVTFYLPVVVDNIGLNGLVGAGFSVPNIMTHGVLSGQM